MVCVYVCVCVVCVVLCVVLLVALGCIGHPLVIWSHKCIGLSESLKKLKLWICRSAPLRKELLSLIADKFIHLMIAFYVSK